MKKLLILVALLISAMLLFAACDQTPNSNNPSNNEGKTDLSTLPENPDQTDDPDNFEDPAPHTHVEEAIPAVNTTDTTAGTISGVKCSACGEILVKPQTTSVGLEFMVYDTYAEVSGIGSCTDTQIVIPEVFNELPVKTISDKAFYGCGNLSCIIIPNSIISIGNSAFYACTQLVDITFSNSLKSIGEKAFYDCNDLTNIVIPNSLEIIGNSAFYRCAKLETISICGNSKLQKITASAFEGCENLSGIYIADLVGWCNIAFENVFSNPLYYAHRLYLNGNLLTELKIPDSITKINSYAFSNCKELNTVTIGSNSHLKNIGASAFWGCSNLESMTLPFVGDSIKTENDTYQYPFGYIFGTSSYTGGVATTQRYFGQYYNASLSTTSTTYYIPSSLKSVTITGGNILYGAFHNCSSLTSITIPDGVTYIGGSAFSGCSSLTSITIPNSVTSVGWSAFSDCSSLTSITIPDGVTYIGYAAFSGCSNLESITLPFVGDSIKTASDTYQYPFGDIFGTSSYTGGVATTQRYFGQYYNASLSTTSTTYYIPSSLKSVTITGGNILYGAFHNCSSLTSITIPDGVTYIGASAFEGCWRLTSITIPDGVTYIGTSAFNGCSSLTSITIPDSVTSIGEDAFLGCSSLISVTIGNGIKSIGKEAFYKCSNLTSVTIGNSVTSIGEKAFWYCYKLVEVWNYSALTITKGDYSSNGDVGYYALVVHTSAKETPNVYTTDDGYIFYENGETVYLLGYTGTDTALTLPANYNGKVYEIYQFAFYGCDGLTSVTISNSVTSIGSYAFEDCNRLTSVTIGNSVTSIGKAAFSDCSSLTSITIPNSVTSIGKAAFSDCSSLTSITIPNSVISIGWSAFWGCSSLTSITIPNSVTSIGDYAFKKCSGLTSITFQGTKAEWGAIKKGSDWNSNTGSYIVYCTDGKIVK